MRGRPAEPLRGAPFFARVAGARPGNASRGPARPLVAQLHGAREAHFRSENTSVYVRVSS